MVYREGFMRVFELGLKDRECFFKEGIERRFQGKEKGLLTHRHTHRQTPRLGGKKLVKWISVPAPALTGLTESGQTA